MAERALPAHDLEAERVLVATAALDPACLADVALLVRPEDCYRTEHQEILAACYALADQGRDVEIGSLRAWLADQGRLSHAGGAEYLAQLEMVPTTVDPASLANRVALLAGVRRLDEVLRRRATEARAPIADLPSWISETASAVTTAADAGLSRQRDTMRGVREVAQALADRVGPSVGDEGREQRIGTGLASLDRQIGKLYRGHMHIVAARPGVGKSALAQQIVLEAARRGVRCLVCSIEMAAEDLLSRSVAWIAGVDHSLIERGELDGTAGVYADVLSAIDHVSKLPIVYEDATTMTVGSIRGAIRRAAKKLGGPVELLAVDYVQKIKTEQRKGASRTELLGEVSGALLATARDFDLALVAVAQLNRPPKGSKPAPPRLEDIRECGDFEQDARVVLGLHREDLSQATGPAEVHALKCRQGGRVGVVTLTWTGPTMSYADCCGRDDDPAEPPLGRSWSPRDSRPAPRSYHEPPERDDPDEPDEYGIPRSL